MSETKKVVSEVQIRAKIQEVIAEHTRPAIGRFHAKELNEKGFVSDLLKKFEITPKESQ